jgi:hypothetical protein
MRRHNSIAIVLALSLGGCSNDEPVAATNAAQNAALANMSVTAQAPPMPKHHH